MKVKVKRIVNVEMDIKFPFYTREYNSVSKWSSDTTRLVVKNNSLELIDYSLFSPDNEISESEFKQEFYNFLKKLNL